MVEVNFSIKDWFFDREAVLRAVDAGTRIALSRAGAFVRQRAKSLIRKRKRVSRPGEPPSSHVGLLRRFILFGYEPASKTVVIGPVAFNRRRVPSALEFGGRIIHYTGRIGSVILPRPYMSPALAKEVAAGTILRSFSARVIGP